MNRFSLILPVLLLSADRFTVLEAQKLGYAFRLRDPDVLKPGYLDGLLGERSIDLDIRFEVLKYKLSYVENQTSDKMRGHFAKPKAPPPLRLAEIKKLIVFEATRSGIDPIYMLKLARRESSFNPKARSSTSTAAGLYQFTENTWLCALKAYGPSMGVARSNKIKRNRKGVCEISNMNERRYLLSLRYDPYISTKAAVRHTLHNYKIFISKYGYDPTHTELYILHFFGENSGLNFLKAQAERSTKSAIYISRTAANSNTEIFYKRSNVPRNIDEVFDRLSM